MAHPGIGLILLVLTQTVTLLLRHALSIYLKGHADSQIMLAFFEHTLKLPLKFFQQRFERRSAHAHEQ